MKAPNTQRIRRWLPWLAVPAVLVCLVIPGLTGSQPKPDNDKPKDTAPSSYDQIAPVLLGQETFQARMAKDKADKQAVMARQQKLLAARYDLSPRVDKAVTMSRGKPIPVGPAAKLTKGTTWETLARMSSEAIREEGLF